MTNQKLSHSPIPQVGGGGTGWGGDNHSGIGHTWPRRSVLGIESTPNWALNKAGHQRDLEHSGGLRFLSLMEDRHAQLVLLRPNTEVAV